MKRYNTSLNDIISEQLRKSAEENKRSLSAEIAIIIEQYFKNKEKNTPQ
jgi:hypothetical protein